MPAKINRRLWAQARAILFARESVCAICKEAPGIEADHIIPRFIGGSKYAQENLQALCSPCHMAKDSHIKKVVGGLVHKGQPKDQMWYVPLALGYGLGRTRKGVQPQLPEANTAEEVLAYNKQVIAMRREHAKLYFALQRDKGALG